MKTQRKSNRKCKLVLYTHNTRPQAFNKKTEVFSDDGKSSIATTLRSVCRRKVPDYRYK